MADALAVDDPLSSLPITPFSPSIFSHDFTLPDDYLQFDDDFFDFTVDNNHHHPSDTEELFNSTFNQSNPFDSVPSDPQFNSFVSDPVTVGTDSGHLLGNQGLCISGNSSDNLLGNQGSLNIPSPYDSGNLLGNQGSDVFRSLNDSGRGVVEDTVTPVRIFENPASSQGSGNCGSAGSEAAVICPSPDSGNSAVDQKLKREKTSNLVLKRKKVSCGVDTECRMNKQQSSNETTTTDESLDQVNDMDERKKARLIRNRESAQLSRQRKKQYVEELEEKIRLMHATVQDLNARVAYIAAENAALKQQMVAGAVGGGAAGAGVYSPPVMYPPHPAIAPMGYPWMPCPPYVVKSQGSQVPLVPIPKLKPQQPASESKKVGKKTEGASKAKTKTKKVASISFIGLLLFIVLFGGLVPIMNVKFGGVTYSDQPSKFNDFKFYNRQHHGRVLMGDERVNGTSYNASEPLVASLYVPRNNKLVKIDGSLIINSVLASEKAMAFREKQETTEEEVTGSAVALDLVPAIPVSTAKWNDGRQPHMYRTSSEHQRALPSNEENLQSKHVDGKQQQWFREGLSGLMLSSGMCTEVFQFDTSVASASGAIVPATSGVNITASENCHNSTSITTVRNRRILPGLPIPLPDSTTNITKEQMAGHDSKHEDRQKHNPVSSMVVSVLVDPREAGDGSEVDGGMMGGGKGKSFSRIFVVVLLDSVKYVTYSCMLPLKGSTHRVTA